MRVFTLRGGDLCPHPSLLSLAASAVFLLTPAATWGQQVSAAITGKITDQTGAVVAGAKVTATDTDRGTVWSTVTNDTGVYNLPRVPIGSYTVKVEKPGFQTAEHRHRRSGFPNGSPQ